MNHCANRLFCHDFSLRLLGLLLLALLTPRAWAVECSPGLSTGIVTEPVLGNPTPLDWEGASQEQQVCFPSRQSGAILRGYLVAPLDIDRRSGPLPVVIIAPGSLVGQESYYRWSARELASHGYLALTVDPQGVGGSDLLGQPPCSAAGCPGVPPQQASNYVDGLISALDYLFTQEAAWLHKADLQHVGLAGHSLSARAVSYVQGVDTRVQAVVAWDNLASDLAGDAGSASGGGLCGSLIGGSLPTAPTPVTPRVPAMGQASDSGGTCTPTNTDPETKKIAFELWRNAKVPAMEVVFAGVNHLDWAQLKPTSEAASAKLQLFQYYTRAWFDLFLKNDASAKDRLLASRPLGEPVIEATSSSFRSAVYLPEDQIDSVDFAADAERGLLAAAGEGAGGGGVPPGLIGILLLLSTLRRRSRHFLARGLTLLLSLALLTACGGANSSEPVDRPGSDNVSGLPVEVPPPGPALMYWPAAEAPQLQNTGIWQAEPILISGASAYRRGEFLYQDFLYDDHGAQGLLTLPPLPALNLSDANTVLSSLFALPSGAYTYPTGPGYNGNAADLLEFRVKPLADATAFRISLNTLLDPKLIAFSIALGGRDGEAQSFPFGANVSAPADYFLTVHPESGTGELIGDWQRAGEGKSPDRVAVTVDLLRRQIEVRIPHELWNPGRERLRLAAGFGLWDASAGKYLLPQLSASASKPGWTGVSAAPPAFFNAAFRGNEPVPEISNVLLLTQPAWWRDNQQAASLAKNDLTPLHAVVDFAKLQDGMDDDSQVPTRGAMDRIFASHFELAQGVDRSVACYANLLLQATPCSGAYLGQLQPYAIYVPQQAQPAKGWGMTLLMHSLYAQYNQFTASRNQSEFGERGEGSIVITPLARGVDGWYRSYAEADVFEVWSDVARHYRLDPERAVAAGYSMGGVGALRLAERYPDLFARVQPTVGADETFQLGNLRNVPVLMWNAVADELAQIELYLPTALQLDLLGYRYELDIFAPAEHLTLGINDEFAPAAAFLGDGLVDRNPAHITYGFDPADDYPELGLVGDHAYWVHDLKAAGAGKASVDLISLGFGLADPLPGVTQLGAGSLVGGTFPALAYTRQYKTWSEPVAVAPEDRLTIVGSNVAELTVDLDRAKLSCAAVLQVQTDVPLEVHLRGKDCAREESFS
jgi:dienelactone hydrolase